MNTRSVGICLLLVGGTAAVVTGQSAPARRANPLPVDAPVYRAGSVFRPTPRVPARSVSDQARRPSRRGAAPSASDRSGKREGVAPVSAEIMTGPTAVESYAGEGLSEEVLVDSSGGDCCEFGMGDPSGGCFGGPGPAPWSAGVELTLLKPQFGSNPAFNTLDSDGATFENFATTSFDFDRELAPRVWLEALQSPQLGIRAVYWQFDHTAGDLSASPPANGFGAVSTPSFGNVSLSTTVPGTTLNTSADLNAYTIDLEGTKSCDCGPWGWLASAGLRYAEAEQTYLATQRNAAGATQGTINFSHRIQGIGPTVSLRTQRPFAPQMALFGMARGSLLRGDGESQLEAIEDQNLDTRMTTRSTTSQDDVLPIGEVQVGLQWVPLCDGVWHPYLHLALEGQVWSDAGNASSVDGDLGFFGFNVGLGVGW